MKESRYCIGRTSTRKRYWWFSKFVNLFQSSILAACSNFLSGILEQIEDIDEVKTIILPDDNDEDIGNNIFLLNLRL